MIHRTAAWIGACICCLLLVACQYIKVPAPTPVVTRPTAVSAPQPTRAEGGAATPGRPPSPEPTVADGIASYPSPQVTLTPSAYPTVVETPPIPTLDSSLSGEERIQAAQRALDDADYGAAAGLWRAAIDQGAFFERPALELGLARAHLGAGDHVAAIALLAQVITSTARLEEQAQALGLLAGAYEELGEWQAAIDTFGRYLTLDDAAEPYVRWHMAAAYEHLGEVAQAVTQLEVLDLRDLPPSVQAEMLEKMSELHERLGAYDRALEDYAEILAISSYANYRALILQKGGATLRAAGEQDQAIARFQQVLEEYSESPAAYLALLALDDLQAADLDDLQRGLILYQAGQYQDSLRALQRYASAASPVDTARVHYYIGRDHEKLGQYPQAFEAYDVIIRGHPKHELAGDAWMAKARAAAAYGGDPSGLYHEFWRLYPDHVRAPEALWRAGNALQADGAWEQASEFYHTLGGRYPDSEYAPEALFREGLAAYARRDMIAALAIWRDDALPAEDDLQRRARLFTWLGLALAESGQMEQAQTYWQQAVDTAPDSYYGRRAYDLGSGRRPILGPHVDASLPPDDLGASAWEEIRSWMSTWHQEPDGDHDLDDDPLARRTRALVQLGWYDEALETARYLRERLRDEPAGLFAMMQLSHELGLHSATIASAESLLARSREADAPPAPGALRRLLYPTTYGHLVQIEAERYAIDPFLLLSLIRQESRFNPRALSYAGASGLAQVMPAAGEWIASRIGPPDYNSGDLVRPVVSVRFGAWFANVLLDMYDRDWFATLVAYNAGPGNLARWTGDQPIADHDLFYETIPVQQAQDYVRLIYQQYRRYQGIYR